MARTDFEIKEIDSDRLFDAMMQFGRNSGVIIDDVLHNQGGQLINDEIMRILPSSGRKWKGKARAAKKANPFEQKNESLAVTVKTKYTYHYLYFPDDGTNTIHHVGYKGQPREFMKKGAENKTTQIIDLCVSRLINNLEGG